MSQAPDLVNMQLQPHGGLILLSLTPSQLGGPISLNPGDEPQVMTGRRRRGNWRLDDDERGFLRVMRDGFRRDDCDIGPVEAMKICRAFRKDQDFRDDLMIEAEEQWNSASDAAKVAIVGAYGASVQGSPMFGDAMESIATNDQPRDWAAFADFWVKVLESLGKLAEQLLPLLKNLFG